MLTFRLRRIFSFLLSIVLTIILTVMINKYLIPIINTSSHINSSIYFNPTHTVPIYKPQLSNLSSKRATCTSNSTTMADYATITYVTVPSEEVGSELARRLVEHKLAACVNMVMSVESIYEWEGKIQQDNEVMLIIKSHSSRSKDLTEFVEKNHLYKCPEVITTRVDSGSEKYINWVRSSVSKSTSTKETGTSSDS